MRKKPLFTREKRIGFRITEALKDRYENALMDAGMSMTEHLTNQIYQFIKENKNKERKAKNALDQDKEAE